MPHLLLSEVDRAKYGLPEELPFEWGQWGKKTVDQLERQTRADPDTDGHWTVDRIDAGLTGVPVIQPDGAETVKRDGVAEVALVWLILWDAGHRIPWKDFDLRGITRYRSDEVDEGKAQDSDTSNTTTTDPDSPTGSTNSSSDATSLESPPATT